MLVDMYNNNITTYNLKTKKGPGGGTQLDRTEEKHTKKEKKKKKQRKRNKEKTNQNENKKQKDKKSVPST